MSTSSENTEQLTTDSFTLGDYERLVRFLIEGLIDLQAASKFGSEQIHQLKEGGDPQFLTLNGEFAFGAFSPYDIALLQDLTVVGLKAIKEYVAQNGISRDSSLRRIRHWDMENKP